MEDCLSQILINFRKLHNYIDIESEQFYLPYRWVRFSCVYMTVENLRLVFLSEK